MLLGLGFCGMLSVWLTAATLQLGREVAKKIHEVVCTTGMLLCRRLLIGQLAFASVVTQCQPTTSTAVDDSGEEQRVRFSYGELRELPDPVQRYFKFCMAEGQPRLKYCHIKQEGHFRYAQYSHWLKSFLLSCSRGLL